MRRPTIYGRALEAKRKRYSHYVTIAIIMCCLCLIGFLICITNLYWYGIIVCLIGIGLCLKAIKTYTHY